MQIYFFLILFTLPAGQSVLSILKLQKTVKFEQKLSDQRKESKH